MVTVTAAAVDILGHRYSTKWDRRTDGRMKPQTMKRHCTAHTIAMRSTNRGWLLTTRRRMVLCDGVRAWRQKMPLISCAACCLLLDCI